MNEMIKVRDQRRYKYQLKRDVFIPWEMEESDAIKKLSAMAIRVLWRFLKKRTWIKKKRKGTKPVYQNGGLAFTYAEAESMGISKSQFHTIIRRLVAVGFIDVEHQGGGIAKDYSRYAVSERWKAFGTPEFKEVIKGRILWRGFDVNARKKNKLRETVINKYENS